MGDEGSDDILVDDTQLGVLYSLRGNIGGGDV